jgi:hypothetical protein
MSLRLEGKKGRFFGGGKWIGKCPACEELGMDKNGCHLVVWPDGKFGCVVNPGDGGGSHRKRIWELIGEREKKRSEPGRKVVRIRMGKTTA